MIRSTFVLIGTVAVLVNVVHCNNENTVSIERIYDFAQNILNATEEWQHELKEYSADGRKSKFFPLGLLPFHALWGFGGLNALAILFAIKFKIIIVAAVVAISVYYYTKLVAAKKCGANEHYRDDVASHPTASSYPGPSYYGGPYTAYSNPYADEISPYASYHDPTLHSAIPSYAFDHDHYPHHFDHHATDYGHYLPDHMHTPGGMMNDETDSKDSDVGVAASPSGSGSSGNSNGAGIAAMSPTYRRVGRHRRRRENKRQQFDFIDIGELAFRFLGVDTFGCRRRFVCELDFRARTNPITRLAFTFIGRNFFERYRILPDENVAEPQKFTDCAKIFNDCKDAEKYNNIEEEQEEEENDDEDGDNEQKEKEKDIKQDDGNLSEKIQAIRKVADVKIEQHTENDVSESTNDVSSKRNGKISNWKF